MMENEALRHLKLCARSRMFIPKNDVLDTAIKSLENQIKIKQILSKRDSDLGDIIKEVREVVNS